MKKVLFTLVFFTVSFAFGQDYAGVINTYLDNNRSQLGLQIQDIEDVYINSQSFSVSMQIENVYVSQRYQGIEIFNSTSSFAVKNNLVVNANLSFIKNISEKINTTSPSVTPSKAINNAANALGIQSPTGLILLETLSDNSFIFSDGNISLENIPVKLVFQPTQDNRLRLAWDLSIYLLDASHYYSVRIDAITGELLNTNDWVVSCDFGENPYDNFSTITREAKSILFPQEEKQAISFNSGGAQYRVFAMPIESPNHGPDALIANPSDDVASPYGWHDTDGAPGAEFTITRGNNVLAQEDLNGNNGSGASPDGGASLIFDFPYDFVNPPVNMIDASTVNLFYWNNIMHDVWYQYGFDEDSGNFQENNYGNGGVGSDSVNADAQDGSGMNNATFFTPSDGSNPRMQMFLWNPAPVETLTINNGPLAGSYIGIPANFGAPLPVVPLTADLALLEDDDSGASTDPNDGCDPITNGGSLSGKIVVIRRGECEFGFKILAAENEGAIAVIMVNNVPGAPITMAPGAVGGSVTIPSIMISQADGEPIISELDGGGSINGSLEEGNVGPDIDGDLDNGVVMHEYGHGISNRLTGGPINVGCLQNQEQMGEGWSDWFAIILTMEVGDQPEDIRGVGTYDLGQPIDGNGIRPAPYSTDFAINGFTYGNLPAQAVPHGVGFVWATMIWDLNWAFIDQYGFDTDFYTGTGGNNIAMQLVIDGLKLQNCSPGFVDGRDAILQADELTNGGANRCLIWEAFANRGLGLNASQGSPFNSNDGIENFDIPTGPDCTLSVGDRGSFDNNFIIYPNPSNGNINIKSLINLGDVTITIFDINGRIVFTQDVALHDTVSINAERLRTGVYIIKISTDNFSHTAKLLIR